jgi:hypothetical protein
MHYINSSDVSEFLEKAAAETGRWLYNPPEKNGMSAKGEGYGDNGVTEFTRTTPAAQAAKEEQRIGDMYNDDNEFDIYQKGNHQREDIARVTRDEENTPSRPIWKKPGVQKSPKRSIPSVNDPTKFVNSVGRRLWWQ